jgi:hypothetical protein
MSKIVDDEVIKDCECLELSAGHEKLQYCIEHYPDDGNTVFMANFRCTRWLWRKHFKKNMVLSQVRFSEGVDLSHIKKIVLLDISFRTSKYSQVIARQANHNRKTPIVVDILVAEKPGIGYDVYNTVAVKKENFDKNSYERVRNVN